MPQAAKTTVIHGEALEVIRGYPADSFDAVITDPPYGLGLTRHEPYRGRPHWDRKGTTFQAEFWAEVRRVTKPGGNLVAFGHPRTQHRQAVAVEDGGWRLVDQIAWVHGQGTVPRLRWMGAELVRVGVDPHEAAEHAGWSHSLRPALELVLLARNLKGTESLVKALASGSGSGGFNLDAVRIPAGDENRSRVPGRVGATAMLGIDRPEMAASVPHPEGRLPGNVVLEHAADCTDDRCSATCIVLAVDEQGYATRGRGEAASRFYPILHHPKAARSERPIVDGVSHATVKPRGVMDWLVALACRPGDITLDMFAGTGATLEACRSAGVHSVGIEREASYIPLIHERLKGLPSF